jgi:hypothetical protein
VLKAHPGQWHICFIYGTFLSALVKNDEEIMRIGELGGKRKRAVGKKL